MVKKRYSTMSREELLREALDRVPPEWRYPGVSEFFGEMMFDQSDEGLRNFLALMDLKERLRKKENLRKARKEQ